MDVLIVEPLDAEVLHWLGERHAVRYAPHLASEPYEFRRSLFQRARDDHSALGGAGRAGGGQRTDAARRGPAVQPAPRTSTSKPAARAGIEVVRPTTASAAAEAEFVIGALLQMLRRVPVLSDDGLLVGRELGSMRVGLVGMAPAARPLAQLLGAFGARVVGYDPALHARDPLWQRWGVEPLGPARTVRALRRRVRAADLLLALPRAGRRAPAVAGTAEPGAGEPGALQPVRRTGAGRRAAHRPPGGSLVRQHGARHARPGPAAARTSTRCRSRRAWPARRWSHARAAPGAWPGASTSCWAASPRTRTS